LLRPVCQTLRTCCQRDFPAGISIPGNVSRVNTGNDGEPRQLLSPQTGNWNDDVVFCPANKLTFDPRPQLAALFVMGFWDWLHYFAKSPAKLAPVFSPAIQLDTFFVALGPNNRILAMVGCPDGAPALVLEPRYFTQALGRIRGWVSYRVLKKFLIDNHYPFPITKGMGSIEFVVADPEIRGRGLTGRLIEYVMHKRQYTKYVLEVASTNTRAVHLYQRLGFTELMRKPASKPSGVGHYIYMLATSTPWSVDC